MLWIAVFTVLLLPKCILAQISSTSTVDDDDTPSSSGSSWDVPTREQDETIILQNDETVAITSPNYTNYYGKFEDKLWKIVAPDDYRIRLYFTDFNTEESYDFVVIYDETSRARFSGNSLPLNVTSASRYMWIWFTSDRSNQFRGFRAIAYAVAPASASTINDITTFIGSSDVPTQVPESTSTINDDTTPSGSSDVSTQEQASTSTINDITTPSGSLDMPILEQVKTESNLMIILTSTLTPLLTIALLMVILCGALRRKRLKERTYHLKPAPDAKENHGTRDNPAFQSPDDFGGEDSYMTLTTSQEDPSSKLYQKINKINQTDGNEVPIDDVHGTTDAEYVTLQDLPTSLESGYELTHVCEDSSGTVGRSSSPQ